MIASLAIYFDREEGVFIQDDTLIQDKLDFDLRKAELRPCSRP